MDGPRQYVGQCRSPKTDHSLVAASAQRQPAARRNRLFRFAERRTQSQARGCSVLEHTRLTQAHTGSLLTQAHTGSHRLTQAHTGSHAEARTEPCTAIFTAYNIRTLVRGCCEVGRPRRGSTHSRHSRSLHVNAGRSGGLEVRTKHCTSVRRLIIADLALERRRAPR